MGNKIQLILIIVVGLLVATNIFTYTKVTALGKETHEHNLYSEAGHSHNYMYSSQNHTHSSMSHYHNYYASESHRHDEYVTHRDFGNAMSRIRR